MYGTIKVLACFTMNSPHLKKPKNATMHAVSNIQSIKD